MIKKKITDRLGLKHPIFQAPMAGGITNHDFVSTISNFGMLGSIASGYLTLAQTEDFIKRVKERTSNTFSLNLFVDYEKYKQKEYLKPQEIIDIEKDLGSPSASTYIITQSPPMDDFVELIIREKIPIISTTFGLLNSAHVKEISKSGTIVFTTVNSVNEIEEAAHQHKSNFFIYQNSLAGGHKGGFSANDYSNEEEVLKVGKNNPDMYIILAGGIVCKKDIKQALSRGFDGVQIGTAFLITQESLAPDIYKKMVVNQGDSDKTIPTLSITGKQARGIANKIAKLDINENPGFPLMHYATSSLRQYAKKRNISEFQSLWAGAGSYQIKEIFPLEKFMESLVE